MSETLLARADVPKDLTWNAESVFESNAAWDAERTALEGELPALEQYPGTLGTSPAALAGWLKTAQTLGQRMSKLFFFAYMSQAVDTTNQQATAMVGQAGSLYSRFGAATSFAEPEILAIGEATVKQWLDQDASLGAYRHYFDNLFRQQAHVRSAEVEEVLALATDPFMTVGNTQEMLASADLTFEAATDSAGNTLPVAQGTIDGLLINPDREARRTGWEHYADGYLAMKNTLASNYAASVKKRRLLRTGTALRFRVGCGAVSRQH